jgi:hypothetical protein
VRGTGDLHTAVDISPTAVTRLADIARARELAELALNFPEESSNWFRHSTSTRRTTCPAVRS